MQTTNRVGRAALTVGALLNLTRMVPLFASGEIDMQNFPPTTATETARLALLPGHYLSHIMALIAFPLLLFGTLTVYEELRIRNQRGVGLAALVGLGSGLLLFTIAAVVDGLVLPLAAEYLTTAPPSEQSVATFLATYTRRMAVSFGGLATAALLSGTGLLGLGISHGIQRPWLGGIGTTLGVASLFGYGAGVLDLQMTENFQLLGSLTMAMILWFLVLGVIALRGLQRNTISNVSAVPANA